MRTKLKVLAPLLPSKTMPELAASLERQAKEQQPCGCRAMYNPARDDSGAG